MRLRGKAITHGAISVVNAIPSGTGITLGVGLKTVCTVQLDENPGNYTVTANGVPVEPILVIETIRQVMADNGMDVDSFSGIIETNTEIPIGVGLKSSSSVSTAVALALCSALRIQFDFEKILKWSSTASLIAKKSITGAMDDAAACIYGGLNVVDNRNFKILASRSFEDNCQILIGVPNMNSRRDLLDLQMMSRFDRVMNSVIEIALAGDVWNALTLNGIVISELTGYGAELLLMAIKAGAISAGISGTGPAVVAIFSEEDESSLSELSKRWSDAGGILIRTKVNNTRAKVINLDYE